MTSFSTCSFTKCDHLLHVSSPPSLIFSFTLGYNRQFPHVFGNNGLGSYGLEQQQSSERVNAGLRTTDCRSYYETSRCEITVNWNVYDTAVSFGPDFCLQIVICFDLLPCLTGLLEVIKSW